jgi:hypothetical protein
MAVDRKHVVTENMTMDGVIDAAEGWFSTAGSRCGPAGLRPAPNSV